MINTTNVGGFATESNSPELDFVNFLVDRIATKVAEKIKSSTPPQLIIPSEVVPKRWETREETKRRHKITDPTLNKWVRNGKITKKLIEGKPYYLVDSAYQTLDNQ